MAEWKWAAEDASMGMTVYADPATIAKTGDTARMESLVSFQSAQGKSYKFLSQKEQEEYDCMGTKSRMLSFSRFSKSMATGETVYSANTPSGWTPVAPGSAGEILWAIACGKLALPSFK